MSLAESKQQMPTVAEMRRIAQTLWPERVVPAATPYAAFAEAGMRYAFAAQFVSGRSVLDLACGTGIGSSFLRGAGALRVVGVDISEDCVKLAGRLYQSCAFVVGNGGALPFAATSFDVVVSFETIEHVSRCERFLQECHRVLKAGGTFICSTPNLYVSRFAPNPFHHREFRPDEFRLLLQSRFERVELHAQRAVNLLTFVPWRAVIWFLALLRLKETLKRVFTPHASSLVADWAFDPARFAEEYRVHPYEETWTRKPSYVVAVARKA